MYPYAQGNLLESPNTYFYTEYRGAEFLDAWSQARSVVRSALFQRDRSSDRPDADPQHPALERLFADAVGLRRGAPLSPGMELLLKRFEVTKRVFDAYDEEFRPLDRTAYTQLGNYVRLAETFDIAYDRSGDLRMLNALLKILDTLCAHHQRLDDSLGARVAHLLGREQAHVRALAATIGVSFP
jgi:hypothetical protein